MGLVGLCWAKMRWVFSGEAATQESLGLRPISVNLFWLLRVELLLLCFAYSRRLSQLSGNVGPILD